MSRVGNKPIALPKGVTVKVADGQMAVKGPKGELARPLPPLVSVAIEGTEAQVKRENDERRARAMHGLTRALLQNMVTGVSEGYTRTLEINGVGYRAEVKKNVLGLVLGYSHPIEVFLPDGVSAKVEKNRIEVSGIDKEKVGQTAAIIRDQRPPEPYKGKGVKYVDEYIRRKEGKSKAG